MGGGAAEDPEPADGGSEPQEEVLLTPDALPAWTGWPWQVWLVAWLLVLAAGPGWVAGC